MRFQQGYPAVKCFLRTESSLLLPGKKVFDYWVDIVSGCNLLGTACPVGMPEFPNGIGKKLK